MYLDSAVFNNKIFFFFASLSVYLSCHTNTFISNRAVVDGLEELIHRDEDKSGDESAIGITHAMARRTIEAASAKSKATHSTTWTVRCLTTE